MGNFNLLILRCFQLKHIQIDLFQLKIDLQILIFLIVNAELNRLAPSLQSDMSDIKICVGHTDFGHSAINMKWDSIGPSRS